VQYRWKRATRIQNYFTVLQRVNTIWEIRNEEWNSVRSFPEIAELGEKHFKNLYKEL
jgi:hypothetical protein